MANAMMSADGRTSIKNLIAAMRFSKAHPESGFNYGGPWRERMSCKEFRRWFMARLDEKITGKQPAWRKLDSDYQRHLIQAAHMINHPRLIIDWLPKDLEKRFAHRLRRNMEL